MTLTIDDLLKRSEQALENADTLRAAWKEIWKVAKEQNPSFTTPNEAQAAEAINAAVGTFLQESLACSQLAQTRILLNVSSLGDTEDTIRFYDSYAWELRNLR